MTTPRLLLTILAISLSLSAQGQSAPAGNAPSTAPISGESGAAGPAIAPTSNGIERRIDRQANPVESSGLLLYADTLVTSRSLRISPNRQLYIRSEIGKDWYRALYGGSQFFVKRTDVALLDAARPSKAGTAPRKPGHK